MNNNVENAVDARFSDKRTINDLAQNAINIKKGFVFHIILSVVAFISIILTLNACEVNKAQSNEYSFNFRYFSTKQMAIYDALAEDEKAYFKGLQSDDMQQQYFAINKLIEYYNDDNIREKAVTAITPFLQSNEKKLSDAATFALSVLTKTYDNSNIYHLADDIMIFTLFNNYSDYGSNNEIWMIRNDELSKYFTFDEPSMYITSIVLSPDKRSFAVTTCSNKSTYLVVFDKEGTFCSPELIDSAKYLIAKDKNYVVWQRQDYENYCSIFSIVTWTDNSTIEFGASFSFEDMDVMESATITYNIHSNQMKYKL